MNTDSTDKKVVQEINPGQNHHEAQIISNITRPLEANQAIDFSRRTGPDTFKRIRRLMTPDGMQDVVCLVDCEAELNLPSIDHLAWYDMPEQGNCFGARQVTSAGAGTFSPAFSIRTETQMAFSHHFQSHCLVKLYCMTPLPMSVSYWVYRTLFGTTTNYLSQIGFTWKPSFQNTVYVLMPWADITLVRPYDHALADVFGFLGIQPLSPFIHEEGTQSSADVTVYFAPYQLKQATPRALTRPATFLDSSAITSTGSVDLTLKAPSKLHITGLSQNGTIINQISEQDLTIDGKAFSRDRWVFPGKHILGSPTGQTNYLSIMAISNRLGNNLTLGGIADSRILPGFILYKDTGLYYLPSLSELKLDFNDEIDDPIQRLIDAGRRGGRDIVFTNRVLRQQPDEILATLSIDKVDFATFVSSSAKKARKRLAHLVIEILDDEPELIENATEQIREYQYNPDNKIAEDYHGQQGDASVRETEHWQRVATQTLADSDGATVFNVSLDLNTVSTTAPQPTFLREYLRHLLHAKYPLLKVQVVKTPFSHGILRIVQGTVTTPEEVNQLPYREFDLTQDTELEFYWDHVNPAIEDVTVDFSYFLMGHSIAPSSIVLNFFFNISSMHFFHYKDYDDVIEGELQIGETSVPTNVLQNEIPHEATATTATPKQVQPIGAVISERKYHFAGYVSANASTTQFVVLPLSHTNFPKYELTTAKRYWRWRGIPYVRITLDSNFTLAGIVYAVHCDSRTDYDTLKAEQLIAMYPSSKQVFKNGVAEMPLNYRAVDVRQYVSYATVPLSQIGDLVIVLPSGSPTTTGLDPSFRITFEFDMSNVTYEIPECGFEDFSYPGFVATLHTFPALAKSVEATSAELKDSSEMSSGLPAF